MGWYTPDGAAMTDDDWEVGYARSLAVFLNGEAITTRGPRGERIIDSSFLMFFNAAPDPISFIVPEGLGGDTWEVELDTAFDSDRGLTLSNHDTLEVAPWAVVVLRRLSGRGR